MTSRSGGKVTALVVLRFVVQGLVNSYCSDRLYSIRPTVGSFVSQKTIGTSQKPPSSRMRTNLGAVVSVAPGACATAVGVAVAEVTVGLGATFGGVAVLVMGVAVVAGVAVEVGLALAAGDGVAVCVGVAAAVGAAVRVGVALEVGVGVGVFFLQATSCREKSMSPARTSSRKRRRFSTASLQKELRPMLLPKGDLSQVGAKTKTSHCLLEEIGAGIDSNIRNANRVDGQLYR